VSFTIQGVLIASESGYETVDVQIVGERITAIAPQLEPLGTLVEGKNKLLLPGFVNAHTHSPEMWQRGSISPMPLELWLAELYDFAPLEPEQVYLSALHTAAETLLSGGTCLVDHLILIPGREIETIAAAAQAYKEIGIRAFIAPLIQDASLAASLPSGGIQQDIRPHLHTAATVLALIEQSVAQFHQPEIGISVIPAPTGVHLCSDELLKGCVELSDRHQLCLHTHLLETRAQQLLAQEKYGCSAVAHLHKLGFLGERTSLAHCVWLEESDITILAETQSTVVHNPLSNLRLGSGIAPIFRYLESGVNVAFGCDGASSNDAQDLLEAIKIGSILHNVTDPDYRRWITPRQAIAMASLGGAKGLNLADEIGTLTLGKKADCVLYDLTHLSLLPRTDPIGLLVLGRSAQAVHSAWVNGKQVVSAGQLTTVDLEQLRQALFAQSQEKMWRDSRTLPALEKQYRTVMGLTS
jgi:guanine deaminase